MRILLGILCGIMVLFAGGCAIMAAGAGPVALIPAGIATLNVLVLIALFGTAKPVLWAFYVLAVLDIIGLLVVLGFMASLGPADSASNGIGVLLAGSLAVKAILTVLVARRK